MKIGDKYLSLSEYEPMPEQDKAKEKRIVLSDDAYAICDFIECLINKIEHTRISMIGRK